jgi:hypothetical protein
MLGVGMTGLNGIPAIRTIHVVFRVTNSGRMVTIDAYRAGWTGMTLLFKDELVAHMHPRSGWPRNC